MKVIELLALLGFIIIFFYAALSTLPNIFKIVLVAATLFGSGAIIARLTKTANYYGMVILKGKYGLNEMKIWSQKYSKVLQGFVDLWLSLGFGVFYSYFLFGKNLKKFGFHLLVLLVLFFGLGFTTVNLDNLLLMQIAGILFGLAGMGVVSIALNAFAIFTIPNTPAGVMPVVPGVTVPFEAIFALILVAVVHEASHGIFFFAEKLKVKNSGVALLGFIPLGAFVESDDKSFEKHNLPGKRRILAAGSASNFYMMLIFLPLLIASFSLVNTVTAGVSIAQITAGSPADGVLSNGDVVIAVNGTATKTLTPFVQVLSEAKPGDMVSLLLLSGKTVDVALNSEGKLGVQVANYVAPENSSAYSVYAFIAEILKWVVLFSLGLAVTNLIPLFITDGHQILRSELNALFKHNLRLAGLLTNIIGGVMLALILFNLLPFLK